jgi:hypothetical protein
MLDWIQTRAWGTGSVFGAGQTHAVGSGVNRIVGGGVVSVAHQQLFMGTGGTAFTGSGTLSWQFCPQARATHTQTQVGDRHVCLA